MARRSDHNREELKEMAIAAGWDIIRTEGASGFSARKVAARIGYTVGTVYNIFGTHDNLLLHIHARTLDAWYDAMLAKLAAKRNPATVRDLASFYIDYSASHTNEWRALFELSSEGDTPLPGWYSEKLTRFFTVLEGLVLPHVGGSRKKAHLAARVLWAGIHGICGLSLSHKLDLVASESAHTMARSFVDNYLHGLQHRA